ncbi:DeoR/GlpR family DNA-binding transcription regulator [Nocardioides sp.]|uniref:DeoR/GlpR family DNA-binding transcription regulator n=1 Tax=Nocardioides sp. TaxID=35761 RepID=UPI00356537CA
MAQLILERGRLSVADLAAQYDVTTETVRRDLSTLERMGLVKRVHGGAVPANALAMMESGLVERDSARTEEKQRIALAAVDLLPGPGSAILMDAGSTTAKLAALLPRDRRLTVITHAVPVAARLAGSAQIELHLLPGRVRPTTQAAVGADTVAALDHLRVDVAFVGANGLTEAHGLSTPDEQEAATKRAMVASAHRVIALVDASKIGVESSRRFASLAEIDVLITDSSISEDQRRMLTEAGIEVVVA